jgi:hypothetical protein
MISRIVSFLKRQPEAIALVVSVAVFVLGVVAFAGRNSQEPAPRKSPTGQEPRVGPAAGESVPQYIEKKKAHLQTVASRGDGATWAVVSFSEYLKPRDADGVLDVQRLKAEAAQWRVPKPDFKAAEVQISSSVEAALAPEIQRALEDSKDELAGLEGMIASTSDAAAKGVFNDDAARVRETIAFLEGDPGVVYAVILRAKPSALLKLAKARGTRLVDVSEDAAAAPSTHNYAGILPDVLDKAP